MITDVFSTLPFGTAEEELTDEQRAQLEAEAKSERAAFHRTQVRNGPVNFKTLTGGQVRRARLRELARSSKRARRSQVQSYFEQQREHAVLRAHLQGIGVLPYVLRSGKLSEEQMMLSVRWIVEHFGNVEDSDDDLLKNALQRAYDRFSDLSGQERTKIEYTS